MMRVTNKMMTENMIQYMSDSLETLNDLTTKTASGKALQVASDDPSAVSSILKLTSSIKMSDAYQSTAATALEWMEANETALGDMVDLGTDALNTIKAALSDTLGTDELATLVTDLDEVFSSAVEISNSTYNGSYLFAGFKVDASDGNPFTQAGYTVNYSGDDGVIRRAIGVNQSIAVNIDGEATFQPFFTALSSAITAINNNSNADIQTALDDLTSALETISTARTSNGAKTSQLENTVDRLTSTNTELKSLLSTREDANMAEAVSELTIQQTVYETVLEVSQRTISALNLFDYLSS